MKKTNVKEKGITLIALVITIIILLILAGIAIAALTGDNGLFARANQARQNTLDAQNAENATLQGYEDAIDQALGEEIQQVTDENPGVLEGSGTDDDPYTINSIEDLVYFSYDVNNGNTYEGQTVKLALSLDFNSNKSYVEPLRTNYGEYGYNGELKTLLTTGEGFKPIGEPDGENSFYGTFDGDNKVICSLYINIDSAIEDGIDIGFFSRNYGEIRNLGLVNINLTAQGNVGVGGVTAINYNKIYNCYTTGNINVIGNEYIPTGGIVGVLASYASIEQCYNAANIECKNIKQEYGGSNIGCGGIAGQGGGNIDKCFNLGNITVDGGINDSYVGGICGNYYAGNDTNIKNSYNNAKIESTTTGGGFNILGGIVGQLGSGTNVQNLKIINCYNAGNIVSNSNNSRVSGIVALLYNNAEIKNVFNIGNIMVENAQSTDSSTGIGGILGVTANGSDNSQINYAYNTGIINLNNTNNQNVGSIIGNRKSSIILNNCYYLTGTYETGVGTNGAMTGITEWQSLDKFPTILEAINSEDVFKEDSNNINNGYPILVWQGNSTMGN